MRIENDNFSIHLAIRLDASDKLQLLWLGETENYELQYCETACCHNHRLWTSVSACWLMRQDSLCNIMAHSLRGRPTLRMYLLVAASNEPGEKAKLRRKSESGDLAIRPYKNSGCFMSCCPKDTWPARSRTTALEVFDMRLKTIQPTNLGHIEPSWA